VHQSSEIGKKGGLTRPWSRVGERKKTQGERGGKEIEKRGKNGRGWRRGQWGIRTQTERRGRCLFQGREKGVLLNKKRFGGGKIVGFLTTKKRGKKT